MRGYPESLLTGDVGANATVEFSLLEPVSIPDLGATMPKATQVFFNPYLFYDIGFAIPFRAGGRTLRKEDVIASLGAGIRMTVGQHLTGYASFSFPLRDTVGFDASKADPVFNFKLTSQLERQMAHDSYACCI